MLLGFNRKLDHIMHTLSLTVRTLYNDALLIFKLFIFCINQSMILMVLQLTCWIKHDDNDDCNDDNRDRTQYARHSVNISLMSSVDVLIELALPRCALGWTACRCK